MKETREFLTTAEVIQKRHSGWSGVKCDTGKKETTKAQILYRMRFFGAYYAEIARTLNAIGNKRLGLQEFVK